MLFRLFLLFALMPVIELALLIEVGRYIGTAATVGIVLVTGALGAAAMRTQGLSVVRRIRGDMDRGQVPAEGLIDGVMVFVGGLMLLAPGLLTDAAGFVLVLPPTRRAIKRGLRTRLERWINEGTFRVYLR